MKFKIYVEAPILARGAKMLLIIVPAFLQTYLAQTFMSGHVLQDRPCRSQHSRSTDAMPSVLSPKCEILPNFNEPPASRRKLHTRILMYCLTRLLRIDTACSAASRHAAWSERGESGDKVPVSVLTILAAIIQEIDRQQAG